MRRWIFTALFWLLWPLIRAELDEQTRIADGDDEPPALEAS